MRVKSLMVKEPITVGPKASISEAIDLMKSAGIRHLPVVDGRKKLLGLATLDDLKQGLIPSMVADLSLSDLMIRDPVTAHPDDDVEAAARLIYHRKIGGLPVVDKKNKLVGILTVIDILRSFIEMMGLLTDSQRLDVDIGDDPDAVNRAVAAITAAGGRILSIAVAAHRKDRNILYFRIVPEDGSKVTSALAREGFTVVGGSV